MHGHWVGVGHLCHLRRMGVGCPGPGVFSLSRALAKLVGRTLGGVGALSFFQKPSVGAVGGGTCGTTLGSFGVICRFVVVGCTLLALAISLGIGADGFCILVSVKKHCLQQL